MSLSIIDDIVLKIICGEIEDIHEKIDDLKEIILYMLSFEKLVRDEQLTVKTNEKTLETWFDDENK